MSSKSSPCAAPSESSPKAFPMQRAKALPISHASILTSAARQPRAPAPETQDFDSAHFEAAKRLRLTRAASGLTQAELAACSGEDPKTIGLRERGQVNLGPLRLLVVLERAAKLKAVK